MNAFLSVMAQELGARRRRMRAALGGWGQALAEFLLLTGLGVGSLGLFLGRWMPAAAPWGFALPFVFLAGVFLFEARRQRALAAYRERLPAINDQLDDQELAQLLAQQPAWDPAWDNDPDFSAESRAEWKRNKAEKDAALEQAFRAKAPERRQARLDNAASTIAPGYDWAVFLWAFACAVAGAAAFFIAWSAKPVAPVEQPGWQPPSSAVSVDLP